MSEHCGEFEELLVDLADGELSGAEERRVREHVARCSGCRALLSRLDTSLVCARHVWGAAQGGGADAYPSRASNNSSDDGQRRANVVAASVAAIIVVATMLLILLPRLFDLDAETNNVGRKEIAAAEDHKPAGPPRMEEDLDIERLLHAREQAARLNAVVKILQEVPELADVQRQTQEYMNLHYVDP